MGAGQARDGKALAQGLERVPLLQWKSGENPRYDAWVGRRRRSPLTAGVGKKRLSGIFRLRRPAKSTQRGSLPEIDVEQAPDALVRGQDATRIVAADETNARQV